MTRRTSLPPHLEYRKSGYLWRRRVPTTPYRHSCETSFSKKFFSFSIRTHIDRDAKIIAQRLTALSDMLFTRVRENTMAIAPDIAERLLTELVRFEIDTFERMRAVADPMSPALAQLELDRELALQDTLRTAIFLGDRTIAEAPVRAVAARMGLTLEEGDEDFRALAYQASKVLLDVSREREKRRLGVYEEPTVYFRHAMRPALTRPHNIMQDTMAAPHRDSQTQAPSPAGFAAPCDARYRDTPSPISPVAAGEPTGALANVCDAGPEIAPPLPATGQHERDAIIPFNTEPPPNMTPLQAQAARVALRPPRLHFDPVLLSDDSRAALKEPRGITIKQALTLHFELRALGYSEDFSRPQVRDRAAGKRWEQETKSKNAFADIYWAEQFGETPVDEITPELVDDALELLWRVPRDHNRGASYSIKNGYGYLIERCDADEAELKRDIERAIAKGALSGEVDTMRKERSIPRFRVDTYLKHARRLGAVGRMLWDMHLIDHNPFSVCVWSNKQVKTLRRREEGHARAAWDDRINKLFATSIFTKELEDPGDALFWAPLIARAQGLRMEEILQLKTDDIGTDKAMPYLQVRNTDENHVKSESSERRVPLHPKLVDLGLMKLVDLRKKQGHSRLFPFLKRGKNKKTYAENFTKRFNYFRRINDVYWPGLDFHALRTTFHNEILSDDGSDAIRRRLMGHAPLDEGEKSYSQSLGMEPLLKRLKSVDLDISQIRKPFDALPHPAQDRANELGLKVVHGR
ncbi:tyrosine-type recombinase/integrase [Thioclava sp.]|uniref:tyrosine-type recombinase/integrase n=1 Tax=Thioclava sp. TaxID=1933450 RepID=UPI003AA80753